MKEPISTISFLPTEPRYPDIYENQHQVSPPSLPTYAPSYIFYYIQPIKPSPFSRSPSKATPEATHSASNSNSDHHHSKVTLTWKEGKITIHTSLITVPAVGWEQTFWSHCQTTPSKSKQTSNLKRDSIWIGPVVWGHSNPNRHIRDRHLVWLQATPISKYYLRIQCMERTHVVWSAHISSNGAEGRLSGLTQWQAQVCPILAP